MYRVGQLDPVVLLGSHEGITWRRYGAAEALVGRQEPDYRGKFLGIFWDDHCRTRPKRHCDVLGGCPSLALF